MRNKLTISIALSITATAIIGVFANVNAGAIVDSPLSEWRGFGHRHAEDDSLYLAEFRQRDDLIAECMSKKGVPYERRTAEVDPSGASLAIEDTNVRDFADDEAEERYAMALHGEPSLSVTTRDIDANGDGHVSYEEKFGYGCSGDAHRAVVGVYAARAVLTEQYNELLLSVNDSAVLAKAETDWLDCMAVAGYKARSRIDFISSQEGDLESSEVANAMEECDSPYRTARFREITKLEEEFVKKNIEVLERYGVPAN